MAAAFLSIAFFLLLAGVITVFGYKRLAKPAQIYEQLGGVVSVQNPTIDRVGTDEQPGLIVSVIEQIGQQVPLTPVDITAARGELIAAGYRGDQSIFILYGLKVVMCAAMLILAFLFRDMITSNGVLRIVAIVAAAGAGYFGPTLYLEYLVDKRREDLRLSLPDALDLMVVCVEAGLGLDQAIQYVGRELAVSHPALAQELQLVNLEMRAGKRRGEALRNLSERTGETELGKLVAILIQTDKFGTSMSESLRTHSDFMRVRRRQEAEERAGKVGVKLVFPIFFCILPAMMLVAAGPGLLQIFKYLFPMMRQFKA